MNRPAARRVLAGLLLLLLAAPASICRAAALNYPDGTTKALSDEDLRWLAVVIYGETDGGADEQEAAAMTWTLAQRSYWSPTWNKHSIADLAKAYSTTTSPKYLADGSVCRARIAKAQAAGTELPTGDACAAHRFPLRQCYQSLTWDDIKDGGKDCHRWDRRKKKLVDFKTRAAPAITTALERFKAGALDNPVPGAIGWLGGGEWKKVTKRDASQAVATIRDNVYYASTKPGKQKRGMSWDTTSWGPTEIQVK